MMKLLIFIPAVRRNPTGFSRRQCLASSLRLLICAATAVRSASRWERTQPTSYSLKWHCAADLLPECGELLRGCSYKPIPYRCLRQIRTASLTCGSVPHLSTTWISGLYSWRVAFRIKGRAWRTMLHHCQLLWHSVGNCRNKGCFSSISKERVPGETSRPAFSEMLLNMA